MNAESTDANVYYPPSELAALSYVPDYEAVYAQAEADPAAFWADRAEELDWYQKWDQVLDDSQAPFFKWFVGAKTNIVHNALDRHVLDLAAQQTGHHLGGRGWLGANL